MNIFFGKISQKFDTKQIEEGYYHAKKGSSWFGKLDIDDYVYLIGGNKIQFWQAERWENYEDSNRLYFKILNKDLGIEIKDLISLSFFQPTITLLVKTVRSTGMEKCAFFKINTLEEHTEKELADSEFYKNESLYRNIKCINESEIDSNSKDIQIYQKNDQLYLFKSPYWEDGIFNTFRDNLSYLGKGQKNKDTTIKKIQNSINTKTPLNRNQLDLRSFYDAFFCEYKEKDIETSIKEDENKEKQDTFLLETISLLRQKKNLILQGAPGTGKTYSSAEIVVAMCNGLESLPTNREDIMKEYHKLVADDRVVFTTFHQSMDYEEFVEGIKPELSGDNIVYSLKPGLFKQICENAKSPIIENNNLNIRKNATIWKVSLKGTYENDIRTDCLKNNRIRIGWDGYGENIAEDTQYTNGGKSVLDAFINKMQIGDIVMSCYSHMVVDAIGVVVGDYEWDDTLSYYKRCRKVNWLVKNIRENIYDVNNKTTMTLSTVYRLNNLSLENVMAILENHKASQKTSIVQNTKPYFLIIDEVNRGNISKILGELITLLESDKRLGMLNEIKVKLPYTQEEFGVPQNLFIIGTMNTADRSLGYIDYAVRRRFAFSTLYSDISIIENYYSDKIELRDKIVNLFNNIKVFIEEYIEHDFTTNDLMFGHSYFLTNEDELPLKIKYEIIPLLIEYAKDGVLRVDRETLNKFCEECLLAI